MPRNNSTRSMRIEAKKFCLSFVIFVLIALWCPSSCQGIEAHIAWPGIGQGDIAIIQSVGRYLGVIPKHSATFKQIEDGWRSKGTITMALASDAFIDSLTEKEVQRIRSSVSQSRNPLMVVFDKSGAEEKKISLLTNLKKYTGAMTSGLLHFSSQHSEILRELSGLKLPVEVDGGSIFLAFDSTRTFGAEPLIWLDTPDGGRHVIMAIKRIGRSRLYFAVFPRCRIVNANETFQKLPQVLPALIFMKAEGGEFCWQTKEIMANLTIDDPFLVEPYGNLSYEALLAEMERVNFHTTIAFVPWNFDRSQKKVVDLFGRNPARYSIAFHGNNHDRREFGDFGSHTFETQRDSILQASARMAEFARLTDLPVDRVMIFPHGIAPERTIEVLKQQNFLATVNSRIVPLGSERPLDVDEMLWPVSHRYYGLPVLQRFNPGIDKTTIDILLFLGKPLLFYTHQDFFYKNIKAFNDLAAYVNQKTGNRMRWVSLKEACESLYMERRRPGGGHSVRMMTRSMVLRNQSARTQLYHLEEIMPGLEGVERISIGRHSSANLSELKQWKAIAVAPGEETTIELVYARPAHKEKVSIRRSGFRNHFIRWMSEFRDRLLSPHAFTRQVIALVNKMLHKEPAMYLEDSYGGR